MSEPKVSVIIATRNRPELLKKAIKSAQNQTHKNLQIIVSDDSDGNETENLCANLNDERINYVKNTTHAKSPNGNKNNALDYVVGEYVCFCDDDDELLPNAVAQCLRCVNLGYKCVFADALKQSDGVINGEIAGRSVYKKSGKMSKIDYHCGRIGGEYFKLFSREFIDDFRFDELSFGGENELYIRFFEDRVYYCKSPLYIYRINRDDSATKNAHKHAKMVAHAYIKTAQMCHDIAIIHEPKFLALQYKNAAYYAKISGQYSLMLWSILKSLKISICKENLTFLLVSFLPSSFMMKLSNLRVKIKQKVGI
ncbi:glycosyltransferase family 2 protein [Campylobacter majalis]|uniref:glycosyltransferase family 2 protein n=1 Tax=Campylobacter majalis TaxID=2790656 RepID=UPI003D69472A